MEFRRNQSINEGVCWCNCKVLKKKVIESKVRHHRQCKAQAQSDGHTRGPKRQNVLESENESPKKMNGNKGRPASPGLRLYVYIR